MNKWSLVAPDTAIMHVRRNASTLLARSFRRHLSADEVFEIPNRIVWLRHPINRLQSFYVALNNRIYAPGDQFRHTGSLGLSWEVFINNVLDFNNDSPVYKPQLEQWWYGREFMPTDVQLFEKVDFTPYIQSKRNINASNKKNHIMDMIDEYREDELRLKYWEDYALWNVINNQDTAVEELLS